MGRYLLKISLYYWEFRKVKFWKDLWCEDQTLKEVFPNYTNWRLTKMSRCQVLGKGVGSRVVGILTSRHFNDWELEGVEGLFQKLHPLVVRREVEDVWSWKESRDGIFSVRSLYRFFTRAYSDPFPWGIIWRSWAPMRVSFFA